MTAADQDAFLGKEGCADGDSALGVAQTGLVQGYGEHLPIELLL
jgi:hypothetical protein